MQHFESFLEEDLEVVGLPILVFVERGVPKKRTEEMMMATRLTTLQTPCETGLILDRVLNANCEQSVRSVTGKIK